MRYSYSESMCDPNYMIPLAKAAEEAGYTSMAIPDSLCYPKETDSEYPYFGDGTNDFLEGKPFIEPFSLIPALGAVTTKLRFTTFVMKLPIRQPVLVAKSVSSIAVLTNNRFGFGIGLSPWPEDFKVCGEPWKGRGKRMDEMIEIIRGLNTGEFFEFHGKYYDFDAIKICPIPSEPIPLLIGGHSDAALRRAAKVGDGWMHAGGEEPELIAMVKRLQKLRREAGRENEPFEVHAIAMAGYTLDGAKRLEDEGVTDLIVAFRNLYEVDDQTLEQKLSILNQFADDVVSKV
ncbi:MAG: TIGR03619 family F420-dependent LLM class oxidoreductase [Deltaproteobacteria bacterium]|nr:TIGR03619 family F420-dependent LLM class oxidoreductase [Deltaproteobacteria bacterium]